MTVDFAFKRAPSCRIAYVAWKGPWSDRTIRKNFEKVHRWARSQGLATGAWVFREPGERRWETGVVVKGRTRPSDGIRLRTQKAGRIALVRFDPEVLSPRVVYHGLSDWLRWRKKDGQVKGVGEYREVYPGNPWSDRRAWRSTEVQVAVRP